MSLIDEIKRRVERFKYFDALVDSLPPTPEAYESGIKQKIALDELRASEKLIEINSVTDVQYLLSKLDEVEKVLITLTLHAEARKKRDIGFETVENVCAKALQQLRS